MKRQIAAGEFKARCLALLDDLQQKREEIIVIKRGKPVARLVPVKKKRDTFGYMKGTITILGDIIAPSGETWDAER
jgi:antitoxin (DNA-binding transcriptional repressor) of toxin-antitoxin stability system